MWKLVPAAVRNLELLLAAMSIPVLALIHTLISIRFESPWEITAVAALAIGIVHGFLAWIVRSKQRQVRLQMLKRLAETLSDSLLENIHSIGEATPATRLMLAREVNFAIAQLPGLIQEPLKFQTQGEPR